MSVQRFSSVPYRFKVEVTIDLSYRPSFSTLCSMAIEKLNRSIVSEQCRDVVSVSEMSPPLV